MNQEIMITVKDKLASTDFAQVVSFNSVYTLNFLFDEEWDGFPSRVAVVKWAGGAAEQLFSGSLCPMPLVDSEDADQIFIGVYSINEGKRIASSFVRVACEAGTGGHPSPKRVDTLHDQVLELLNGGVHAGALDKTLTIGDKRFDGSKDVTVTADDFGLARVATSGSYNDLTDKPSAIDAPVKSVNGQTGEVTITKYDLSLAEVAISGSYTDLKDKPEIVYPVTSVNGQTGEVTVDKDTLGLADVAVSGKFSDLVGIPDSGVVSVNGKTGEVVLNADDLSLGALAKLDKVHSNDLYPSAVMNTHLNSRAVSTDKLRLGCVTDEILADGAVTGKKLHAEAIKAGAGASVEQGEDGTVTVGLDTSQVVTSVNGKSGEVTLDASSMGLADVAFSGKFGDLVDAPETGVYSVNGKTGEVTIDKDSLGLADVAVTGQFSDLIGVPEQAVFSVNGKSGEVVLDADDLSLGALAKLDKVHSNDLYPSAVMNTHLNSRAVSTDKLRLGCVTDEILADGAVTGKKLAEGAIKAGEGTQITRDEEGSVVVEIPENGYVKSVNGQTGEVSVTKESLGLTHVTSERQMPLAADTRNGADFDNLFPNGFYHIAGTETEPCKNNPISMENMSSSDCSWFLLVMTTSDNSSAVQVAFSARGDFALRMRGYAKGTWSKWQNIPA